MGVAATGAFAASFLCAAALVAAPDRAQAAVIVPILVLWGLWSMQTVRSTTVGMVGLAAVALLVRLPLVFAPPYLSDDLYRYLWEGLALSAGHNPFLEAPTTIPGLDDALRARVNHPELTSIYPPVALSWFRLLALVGTSAHVVQLATALADVGIVLVLAWARPARDGSVSPAWLYALHPLPVVESALGGHLEVLGVLLALLAVVAHERGRATFALLWLWAAIGTKLFPVILLPTLLRGERPAARWAGATAGAALVALAGLQVSAAGPALFDSFRTYSGHWSFNGLIYPWLETPLGGSARPVLVALGGTVAVAAAWRWRDPARVWWVVGSAFVCLTPTLHPWYLLWALVPGLLLGSRAWAASAVFLLGSYAVLATWDPATGGWSEEPWLWWITWPPALLAGLSVARRDAVAQDLSDPSPTAP